MLAKIKEWYETKYKILLIFPMLLVVLSLLQIAIQYHTTGDFVHKGIGLKGGSAITFDHLTAPPANLESFLRSRFPDLDVSVRTINTGATVGVIIESAAQDQESIDRLLAAVGEKIDITAQHSTEVVGSSLGASFFQQTAIALLIAFILMGIVVFFYFRIPVPSLAVIAAGFSDIVVTLAIFNLTGEKLSAGGVAAFLMLVGYSVDTDMLLTNRVLRREGQVLDKIYWSIRTGMTMTLTTLVAVLVALLLVQSEVIKQIMLILFIGLIVDMIMTWIQNVAILRIYLDHKKAGQRP